MFKSKLKKAALYPFSTLWENIYRLRRSFYEYGLLKKDYFQVPIVSVGNITFGGTGKTPLIVWLVKRFEQMNLTPVVLTRGYKGKLENSCGVLKGGQRFRLNPEEFGDEPLIIAEHMQRGSIVVGKKRAQNLKDNFFELAPDIVLLDDGFQHIQLYRSFNIVLFDALLPLERYKVAPSGYLREGLSALKDADAIIISRADQVSNEKIDMLTDFLAPYHRKDIVRAWLKYVASGVYNCYYEKVYGVESLKGKKVIALTAIASPNSFYKTLEHHEVEIIQKHEFNDHHYFNLEEIEDVIRESVKNDCIILCSEKDMVKIKKISQSEKILFLGIDVTFMSGEKELIKMLKKITNRNFS